MYPNCEIYILSLNTDVFLVVIQFYQKLSPKLLFWMRSAPDICGIGFGEVSNFLSAKHFEAILGWHSFTRCELGCYPN